MTTENRANGRRRANGVSAKYRSDHAAIVPRAQDFVYSGQHASRARRKLHRVGHRLSKGMVGRITLGVDPSATPALIGVHS